VNVAQHRLKLITKSNSKLRTTVETRDICNIRPIFCSIDVQRKNDQQNGSPEDVRNEQPARVVVCRGVERSAGLVQSPTKTSQRQLQELGAYLQAEPARE